MFDWFRPKPAAVARNLPDGALRRFLLADPPAPDTPASQLRLLAIDLETTGLDPGVDQIISTGYAPIDALAIDFSLAGGLLVRTDVEVGQSATIHQLTDDSLAAGYPLQTVLDDVLTALTGRVLLAHHSAVEVQFLARVIERIHGVKVSFESLDTMQFAHSLLSVGFDDEPRGEDLRLWRARARHGLPRYRGHEALTDAIACAELFLAQMCVIGTETPYKKLKKIAG